MGASVIAQVVNNLPAMKEILVQFLGWEDPLEKGIGYPLQYSWASLVAQLVKNPPAMQEIWVQFLGWEDPLEKRKATHSVFSLSYYNISSVRHGDKFYFGGI